ncbi:hypothetical protein H5158_12895 [Pseudoalteromonas sp. SR45-6]|uniref:ORC-CDC6 family AAA ATPase n=1 Tax=Pseudoalteromonas sp. SR45-6 TaxID=2760927 RepID=UPI00160007C4|nr:hypothetical protein [Pseudoalteromonas sp. SR45-6]MBB1342532.1 hypothetical protein [Pseudoalteromonas sp. SR45-6]
MSNQDQSILEVFAKNRAEELPEDLWGQFVLPLDFRKISLREKKKAAVIVGGRGTGKTMFLKYHCHATAFSPRRDIIDSDALDFIGIHWRPDTTFTQNIKAEWLGKYWEGGFNSFISATVLIEFSKLFQNICNSNIKNVPLKDALSSFLLPSSIQKALSIEEKPLIECEDDFQEVLFELSNWIRLPSTEIPPFNLDLKQTVLLLVSKLQQNISDFGNSIFHIFIDEFENLTEPQQRIINTWLKHGEKPLLFSIAYKKFADVSYSTVSQEKLEERDDYRLIDVEQLYFDPDNPKNFEVLASELLLLKLFESLNISEFEDLIQAYSDLSSLEIRKDAKYQKQIKEAVGKLFPSDSHSNISIEVLNDRALKNKLVSSLIKEGLVSKQEESLQADDFINHKFPEASLVNGALLHRTRINPKDLKKEFDLLISKGQNAKYQNWIQNNLVGVLIYLYNAVPQKICPVYAGFSSFILMSKGNLRHFLELCFQSLIKVESIQGRGNIDFEPVPVQIQSKATLVTSTNQLGKIVNSGSYGKHLQKIAHRLGIIFSLHQKRKSQSEPEVNHFSIETTDVSLLDGEVQKLLNEALVWSVLIANKSTKNKTDTDIEHIDYLLHPVLSCHFGISYRKKRKIKLSPYQLKTIFLESDEKFNDLYELYRKKLNVNESEVDESAIEINSQYNLSW